MVGWFTDANVTVGLGWRPTHWPSDLLGVGVGWASPIAVVLREQTTAELSHRLALTQNLTLTPDVQLVVNPAFGSSSDLVVLGFRTRINF